MLRVLRHSSSAAQRSAVVGMSLCESRCLQWLSVLALVCEGDLATGDDDCVHVMVLAAATVFSYSRRCVESY
jgi:hypothetical protein